MKADLLINGTNSPMDQGIKLMRLIDSLEENLYPLEILNEYLLYLSNNAVKKKGVFLSPKEMDRINYIVDKFIDNIQNAIAARNLPDPAYSMRMRK